jgi:hypothetical protein
VSDDRQIASEVAEWVDSVLPEYKGQYEVLDHLFVRGTVRVVTLRRDAFYDIPRGRWLQKADPHEHEVLSDELRLWARRVIPLASA